MSEIPTHDWNCPCELCEPEAHSVRELPAPGAPYFSGFDLAVMRGDYSARVLGPTRPATPEEQAQRITPGGLQVNVTPLQRACLDNGLDFDVVDLLTSWGEAGGLGAETLGRLLTDVQTDQALEEALNRSACAREPEASRLWWYGVLPQGAP